MARKKYSAKAPKPVAKATIQKLRREHARWETVARPIKEAVRQSEQLTDRDFAIRINARS
jgi:hypothetical protein